VSAAELLADLIRQGFTLTPEGEGIRVTPASRLTPAARQAIADHKPALLALLAAPHRPVPGFVWDQAEAERLLAEVRASAAQAEAQSAAGRLTTVRRNLVLLWVEVAEGYVENHEMEARRGWDAMKLLRSAVCRAADLVAGSQTAGSGRMPGEAEATEVPNSDEKAAAGR
jgi:hypothetical protein